MIRKTTVFAAAAFLALGAGGGALATSHMSAGHGAHGHGQAHGGAHAPGHGAHGAHGATPIPEGASASTRAFIVANDRMHEGMAIEFSGDADLDFARGMIPHHQGAIDMARIVLEHGSDPDLRALALEIIAAQETEIAFLEKWVAERGK